MKGHDMPFTENYQNNLRIIFKTDPYLNLRITWNDGTSFSASVSLRALPGKMAVNISLTLLQLFFQHLIFT